MQVQECVDCLTKTRRLRLLPTKEMLVTNETPAICPIKTCSKIIRRSSALRAHMGQHPLDEDSDSSPFTVNLEFLCPVMECVYNKMSERFFSNIKYLKQHYQKVHAVKHLKCTKCHVAFSQQSLLDAHLRQCGRSFQCVCGVSYSSRESYLTHARRQQHEIPVKLASAKRIGRKAQDTPAANEPVRPSSPVKTVAVFGITKEKVAKPRLLLPKPAPINSVPLPTLAAIALSELSVMRKSCPKADAGTQTENGSSSKHHWFCCGDAHSAGKTKRGPNCRIGSGVKRSSTVDLGACRQLLSENVWSPKRLRRTTETQTKGVNNEGRHSKRQKACAETQTLGHLILEKAMAEANLPVVGQTLIKRANNLQCQSIETQTAETVLAKTGDYIETTTLSRANALSHSELMLDSDYPAQRIASSETQTILPGLNTNIEESTVENMSPLHCDTITTAQNYTDLERSTASTQTATTGTLSVGLTQCSSSQTEKDVFLGHMGNPFGSAHAFSPSLASSTLNSVFSPSGCVPLHQVSHQTETCSIQYADLFPQGPSKLNENRVLSSETQTELNFDMLLNCDGDDEQSTDSILCSNIQTQTTDDLESLSYELLTNMHTQTNEDFLFPELTFSDIQTQTSWKDTASPNNSHSVSVHIQTQMPESSTQVINTQTQTFVSPLEIGIEFADSHTQTTWSYMQDLMSDL